MVKSDCAYRLAIADERTNEAKEGRIFLPAGEVREKEAGGMGATQVLLKTLFPYPQRRHRPCVRGTHWPAATERGDA